METEEEKKEEVQSEAPKKKGNGLFTLFACIMTGIIVFLAINIGQKASKVVDPDTGSSKTKAVSNSNSNDASNKESNLESNTTSNVESNVTSNATTPSTTDTVKYTNKSVAGVYEFTRADKTTHVIELYSEGIFEEYVSLNAPGCPDMLFGNYSIEGDKITLYGVVSYGCSCEGKKTITQLVGTLDGNNIKLEKETLTKTAKKSDESYSSKLDGIFSCIYQGQIPTEKQVESNPGE